MFKPKTKRLKFLSEKFPKTIKKLESFFEKKTNIYIDWANVLPWQDKLSWRIDLKRLKQLFDSFKNIKNIKFYYGTLQGDQKSKDFIKEVENYKYQVRTKAVKMMKISIDVSSIPLNSPTILDSLIRKPLLDKLTLKTVEYLNKELKELNDKGTKYLEDKKCNFDVEIGRDMLLDYEKGIENFILWSGDSDFAGPVSQLLEDGKKVFIFATTRRISRELSETKSEVFDIKKIKEFICWPNNLPENYFKSQKDS